MADIEQRKNVNFGHYDAGGFSSFTQYINVSFVPDDMVVRGITWYTNGTSQAVRVLTSDLVTEGILGSFNESSQQSNAVTYFKMNKPVQGTYTFNISDYTGISKQTLYGPINISLEFIKYK